MIHLSAQIGVICQNHDYSFESERNIAITVFTNFVENSVPIEDTILVFHFGLIEPADNQTGKVIELTPIKRVLNCV